MKKIGKEKLASFISSILVGFFIIGGFRHCVFRSVLKIECPGCGAFDAVLSLMQGNFTQAFHDNPLFVISFPILLCVFLYQFICWVRGKRPAVLRAVPYVIYWIILAAIIAFAIARPLGYL